MKYKSIEIILGENNRVLPEGTEQEFYPEQVIKHPLYDDETQANDIALIKLNDLAVLNDVVSLICRNDILPNVGDECILSGFGYTEDQEDNQMNLHQGKMTIINKEMCQDNWDSFVIREVSTIYLKYF